MQPLILTPTDFVATTNQILETSYGFFYIEGELSQLRISKNKWVYFDIKDEYAKVSCFGTVYMLPGPLEDGMIVLVGGTARLHPQFGFSVTVQSIQPTGKGSIAQALVLLKNKLEQEGLFAAERKRTLPTIPERVALVASVESAAYADFMKIAQQRWPFAHIIVHDTLVQGDTAPESLVQAIHQANTSPTIPDVVVVTRGGGSADDLAAFNDERVVRALAASRVPTLVAIGHEIDESLAELVADKRASTPSNAAELLFPDRAHEIEIIGAMRRSVAQLAGSLTVLEQRNLHMHRQRIQYMLESVVRAERTNLTQVRQLLASYNPTNVLSRGYAIVYGPDGMVVQTTAVAKKASQLQIQLKDGVVSVTPQSKE